MQDIPRKLSAQDRYAQELVDWLWAHDELLDTNEEGVVFFRGSIHQLVKKVTPRAQAGDVVNILRESGAISQIAHGIWEICRKHVHTDDAGNPVEMGVVQFGHATKAQQQEGQIQELGKRITALEEQVGSLTEAVVHLAGEVEAKNVVENTPSKNEGPEAQAS